MTTFSDGLYQYGGMPVGFDFMTSKVFATNTKGRAWFVDADASGRNTGKTPRNAFTTMDAAFDSLGNGDIIYFVGNVDEELTTPAQIFDVTIVGCGNQPRHADATPAGGDKAAATWKSPSSPTAATPLLIVQQQGWKLMNILFDGPSDAAAVQVFRDGGAGNAERDGSHIHIVGCKFVAGQNHIELKGGLSQCVIEKNLLFGATAASLLETVGAGIGTNNYHRILGNHFHNNDIHIDVGTNYASITGNMFGKFTTRSVDLRTGSENIVTMNYLYGTYSNAGGYYAGTNDEWGGNANVISGGWTAADPA